MIATVDEARPFFADRSQQIFGVTPDRLPVAGVEYWINGPVCGVFHLAPWPGVWMAHHAVKPEGRGVASTFAVEILKEFWAAHQPSLIMGWTEEKNRLAVAFARRCGFVLSGRLDLPSGGVIIQTWRG